MYVLNALHKRNTETKIASKGLGNRVSLLEIKSGGGPIVMGFPHTGTDVPNLIWNDLNPVGQALADTDWHIHQLYADLLPDLSYVRTIVHRYVIDVNRDPNGQSLYPGQNTTTLCPITDFDGRPIYHEGKTPDTDEIARRLRTYHAPYHAALRAELDRVKSIHGYAILYDCHSIRSYIPFLFEGTLPDFNIGTNSGRTCDPAIEEIVNAVCQSACGYSTVTNGRFKGGWTTRHYGAPSAHIHAVQMELAQSTYMTETPPWAYSTKKAAQLRPHLTDILTQLSDWRPV